MANGQSPQGQEHDSTAAKEPGQGGARQFVNHIEFFLSLSDVKFDLASLGMAARPEPAVWRFVTTPHHLRRQTKKVRPVLPIHTGLLDQPEIGLMHQGRCLQRVIGPLAVQKSVGLAPEFIVDNRHKPFSRFAVAAAPRL